MATCINSSCFTYSCLWYQRVGNYIFSFFKMETKKFFFGLGTVILFIGFFYAFLPHTLHGSVGLGDESSHTRHVIFGAIMVLIGLILLILNEKR